MRTLPLVVMTAVLGMLPLAAFGQASDGTAREAATREPPVHAQVDDASGNARTGNARPRNGFGQVMALLTGLLADAARREASGDDEGFALDNPAVVVSVTPVQGTDSFLRDGASPSRADKQHGDARSDEQHEVPQHDAANARLAAEPVHAPDAMPR